MNCYAITPDLYTAAHKAAEASAVAPWEVDAWMLPYLIAASRAVDSHIDRHFFSLVATKRLSTSRDPLRLLVPDLLSVTSLKTDSEGDGSWDGEEWVEEDDYYLAPFETTFFPKSRIEVLPNGDFRFPSEKRDYVELAGVWGIGNGVSALPWRVSGRTVTVADASTTAGTVDAEGTIFPGHTLLLESEQVFVEAATSDGSKGLTLRRQVNGTTAAAHASGVSASLAEYMEPARLATLHMATAYWHTEKLHGWADEDFDGHRRSMMRSYRVMLDRVLGNFISYAF